MHTMVSQAFCVTCYLKAANQEERPQANFYLFYLSVEDGQRPPEDEQPHIWPMPLVNTALHLLL